LGKANINQSVIQIIRNIYSNNTCRIKIRSNLSDEFCNGDKINYGNMGYLGTDHSEEFQINGNTIPTVKHFGSIVQENGSADLEVEKRISETRRVISMLNPVDSNGF
jgi:hypothetical protein